MFFCCRQREEVSSNAADAVADLIMQVALKVLLAYLSTFSNKFILYIRSVNLYFENGNTYYNMLNSQ